MAKWSGVPWTPPSEPKTTSSSTRKDKPQMSYKMALQRSLTIPSTPRDRLDHPRGTSERVTGPQREKMMSNQVSESNDKISHQSNFMRKGDTTATTKLEDLKEEISNLQCEPDQNSWTCDQNSIGLRAENYKMKFSDALKKEQTEHKQILTRFNGPYILVLTEQPENGVAVEGNTHARFHQYGFIEGLKDFEIERICQGVAKRGVELKTDEQATICRAEVLRTSDYTIDEKLKIAFNKSGSDIIRAHSKGRYKFEVFVNFIFKTSYFNTLEESIQKLPSAIVSRITPKETKFNLSKRYGCELNLDRNQVVAIEAIINHKYSQNHPERNFPIVINGPFGTGKTYVLAVVTHILLQQYHHSKVLVCTQQRKSAEIFLSTYLRVSGSACNSSTAIYLLIEYGKQNPELKQFYIKASQLKEKAQSKSFTEKNLLIVSTCSTSHKLSTLDTELTHIMIDECGLMREPEAIIPLCMAKENTIIVIAGDPQQTGPHSLVLGSETKQLGLGESLLERLLREYQELGEAAKDYHVSLTMNYRCYPDIVSLLQPLFYSDKQLRCHAAQPADFPYKSCLLFTCSSVKDEKVKDGANQREAEVVSQALQELASKIHWTSIGVMAKFRKQLAAIQTLAGCQNLPQLPNVNYIPTYCMQGTQYDALLLSVTEPITTDSDGNPSLSDPTKSLSNPFVFNTAISRARSLVVAVGNPIVLLKVEKYMEREYGSKARCWSNYFKQCLEKGTIMFENCLGVSDEAKGICLDHIRREVEERLVCKIEMDQNLLQYIPSELPRMTKLEEDYTEVGVLGSGGYGIVFHVQRATDKHDFALKLIDLSNKRDQQRTKEEANKLAILKHLNIVQYYNSGLGCVPESWRGWQEWRERKKRQQIRSTSTSTSTNGHGQEKSDSVCLYILTEWCEEGTLRDWLNKHMDSSKARVRLTILNFLQQIIGALEYIHEEKSIAHRDLKPSNIFFNKDEVLKIGDFGFVKEVGISSAGTIGDAMISDSSSLSKYYGTEFYRSPEIRKKWPRKDIDWTKTDIYAAGVILFELCQVVPKPQREKVFGKLFPLHEEPKPQLPDRFSDEHCDEVVTLIIDMTSYDPSQRPSASAVREGIELRTLSKKWKRKEKKRKSS